MKSASEKILLYLSVIASFIISPFIYIRYVQGDYFVFTINILILIALMSFFGFVYKTKKLEVAKAMLATFITIAIVSVVIIRGAPHIYWLYPAIIAFHYILPTTMAGFISILAISIISITFYPQLTFIEFLTITLSLLLTACLSFVMFSAYRETNAKLTRLSRVDPLTLTGNRRALNNKLFTILADQKRQKNDVSLLLLDLDHFKYINDEHGHSIGDKVLIELTSLISKNIRPLDQIFRYGGEEFVIAPLYLNLQQASVVAEKVRVLIEQHVFINDIKITTSIGVAKYRENELAESWLSRADAALYQAKNEGRNRVVTEQTL